MVKYKFVAAFNRWKEENGGPRQHHGGGKWNGDEEREYFVESVDLDDRGDVVAYSAFEENDGGGYRDSVRIVAYDGEGKDEAPAVVHARDFKGWDVDLSVRR